MHHTLIMVIVAIIGVSPAAQTDKPLDSLNEWAQWRGPTGNGIAPNGHPPIEWSERKNVRWKVALPGLGHSTPIVWGDRVFLTAAVPVGEELPTENEHPHGAHDNMPVSSRLEYVVMALNRADGAVLWQRTVHSARPHEEVHGTGSWASNSPATDGRYLFASFGSAGVYCLDMDGTVKWKTDLGDMNVKHGHGEGSSLALHGDTLVINWDHQGESFVVALNKATGAQRWRVPRDEGTSWSTPLIVEHDGRAQVIISATKRVRSYDLNSGKIIWECGGLSDNVVASPVSADGMVYVGSSYETRIMLAIRLADAKGDITGTNAIAWTRTRDTPYVPSPILYEDTLCFLKHYQGALTCVDAKSGRTLFGPERLDGIRNVYASPVGAAGRIYIVDRNGHTVVIKRGGKLELLAMNSLDDSFSASPAIVGGELFLRGERYLYCIAEDLDE